jgi:hypothetical protein
MFRLIARIGTLIGAYKLIRGVLRSSSGGRAAPRRPY